MFTAALSKIAKNWKQSKCPSTSERINKPWYLYTVENYSAINRYKLLSNALCMYESQMHYAQRKKAASKHYKYIPFIWHSRKDKTEGRKKRLIARGWGWEEGWLQNGIRELWGAMEMFYFLTMMVQDYVCCQNSQNSTPKKSEFYCL